MIKRDKTDPNTPTTYHALASAGLELESGGRFAQDTRVTGSTPTTDYPAASGPWSGADPQPPEEPLGESVDDMVPVGTAVEIAESIERLVERERSGDA